MRKVGGHYSERTKIEMTEGSRTTRSEAIVIISSDEEEEEDVAELFREFLSQVERHVDQNNVVVFLKLKFAEARPEFVSSAKFKNALKWRTKQMNSSNGYIYTGDICKLLSGDPKKDNSKVEMDCEEKETDHEKKSPGNGHVANQENPRAEGDVNKTIIHVSIDNCEEGSSAAVAVSVEEIPAEIVDPQPSTSAAQPSTSAEGIKSKVKKKKLDATSTPPDPKPVKKPLSPRKRKQLVKNLELKLKDVSDRIKILNQAELSLDEMDMGDSTYIQECRLKERFNRIWDKICKLKGRPPDTGRVTEKEVKCPTTGVPEIDRAVAKFLKAKRNRFPDRFDISNVVIETNKKHDLKLQPQTLNEISDEVFMCVGNKLQKRRKRDFQFNFGCHLTDDYHPSKDPAIDDLALRKKLDENKKKGKRALDDVFNKFTHYGRMTTHDGKRSSSDSDSVKSESGNNGKAVMERTFSHISATQSSDSSDNECDDFGLEEQAIDDGSDPVRSEEVFSNKSASGKKPSVLNFSDNSEDELDDFAIKTPRRVTEKKEHVDEDGKHDTRTRTEFSTKETSLDTNCAVVELPSSVLPVCDDASEERTAVVEIDCDVQCTEIETVRETNSEKDDIESVAEDQEVTSVQQTVAPSDVVSESLQDSESCTDSNISTQSENNLTAESMNISGPSEPLQTVPCNDLISIDDCDDEPEDLPEKDTASHSSDSVDSQVIANQTPKQNGKHKISINSTSSRKQKALDIKSSPSISIPLKSITLKGHKSPLCLSTKKRKAENGLAEYESPLKIFREATKEILRRKQELSNNTAESTVQKSNCNGSITLSESENDEPCTAVTDSPSVKATTINGHSTVEQNVRRKLPLSLNKGGRNSPTSKQKVVTSEVIVLSDDDSDG